LEPVVPMVLAGYPVVVAGPEAVVVVVVVGDGLLRPAGLLSTS